MRKQILTLAALFSVGLLAFGLWGFIDNQMRNSDSFPDQTRINGVDCSNMTVEEADTALTREWNSRDFIIKADGEYIGKLTQIHFKYIIADEIKDVLVHSGMHPLLTWIVKEHSQLEIPMTIGKVNARFTRQYNNLKFINEGNGKTTKNAYIDMSTPKLPIVSEVYGTNIDKDKLMKRILSRIVAGHFSIDFTKSDYYAKPTILSDNSKLIAKQEKYRKYLAFQITYIINGHTEVLTPKVLRTMMSYKDGEVVVSKTKVTAFIKKLAQKYDTAGMSRTFLATSGSTITVSGGNYGNLLQSEEVKWLTKALKAGKTVTRTSKFLISSKSHSDSDIGTSYVEIDLTKQHLWLYKGGNLILSTPVVTGNVAKGTATPAGTYSIYFMQRDRVLKGDDWDGTKYETPVSYWMAFNGGIGLHDAPWRYYFGGTIYKNNGSHGCINMPPKMAAATYSIVSIGYPVVVHY